MKKVAVIHTTPVTIPTISALIRERIEQVEIYNFLDDSMLPEMNAASKATEGIKYRLNSLLTMAATTKPDAILCACSSIGGLIDEGKELLSIPVLRIDEPMARKAVAVARKIGVAATLNSTIAPTIALVRRKAEEIAAKVEIESKVILGVGSLLSEGKENEYDAIVSKELMDLLERNDVVILAQASMARALRVMEQKYHERLLTSPISGVEALRDVLTDGNINS